MDVFLMVRREKVTIFIDAKENTLVLELKRIIEGIMKIPTSDQRLFSPEMDIMDDERTLMDCGITTLTAKAQMPATVGLACRNDIGDFEMLVVKPYTQAPELSDILKKQQLLSEAEHGAIEHQ